MSGIITLTTDFGTRDGFVAQMKGVISQIDPTAALVDVTHDIEPFSVLEGALVLKGLAGYFPRGVIHLAVVDPGVGSGRRGIVLKAEGRLYVGPDNGLFSLILSAVLSWEAREIQNLAYMLPNPHPTFHGRDVFAPVSAHLSVGQSFEDVGPVVYDPVTFRLPEPEINNQYIQGEVIYIDRFGNLTTNIESGMLNRAIRSVQVGNTIIRGLNRFFGEAPEGHPLALINSFGFLEIAVNRGNAAGDLGIRKGEHALVRF